MREERQLLITKERGVFGKDFQMSRSMTATRSARGLGWTSLAIGAAEMLAPRKIESLLGLEPCSKQRRLMRLLGFRELMHGAGLFAQKGSPTGTTNALWARVAGDVLDTAMLAAAALKTHRPVRFAAISAAVLAIGAIDLFCAARGDR